MGTAAHIDGNFSMEVKASHHLKCLHGWLAAALDLVILPLTWIPSADPRQIPAGTSSPI